MRKNMFLKRLYLPLVALAFWTCQRPALAMPFSEDSVEVDPATKFLGSSVVTSISLPREERSKGGAVKGVHSKSKIGPSSGSVNSHRLPPSPANLLKPDGFQFYTYNERGDMITKQMTMQEIQALIAAGGPDHSHIEIQEPQKAEEILTGGKKVMDVVEKVQSVLKSALGKPTSNLAGSVPTIPEQVNVEWSNILPSILAGEKLDDVVPYVEPSTTTTRPTRPTILAAPYDPLKSESMESVPLSRPEYYENKQSTKSAPNRVTGSSVQPTTPTKTYNSTPIQFHASYSEKPMIPVPVITAEQNYQTVRRTTTTQNPVFQKLTEVVPPGNHPLDEVKSTSVVPSTVHATRVDSTTTFEANMKSTKPTKTSGSTESSSFSRVTLSPARPTEGSYSKLSSASTKVATKPTESSYGASSSIDSRFKIKIPPTEETVRVSEIGSSQENSEALPTKPTKVHAPIGQNFGADSTTIFNKLTTYTTSASIPSTFDDKINNNSVTRPIEASQSLSPLPTELVNSLSSVMNQVSEAVSSVLPMSPLGQFEEGIAVRTSTASTSFPMKSTEKEKETNSIKTIHEGENGNTSEKHVETEILQEKASSTVHHHGSSGIPITTEATVSQVSSTNSISTKSSSLTITTLDDNLDKSTTPMVLESTKAATNLNPVESIENMLQTISILESNTPAIEPLVLPNLSDDIPAKTLASSLIAGFEPTTSRNPVRDTTSELPSSKVDVEDVKPSSSAPTTLNVDQGKTEKIIEEKTTETSAILSVESGNNATDLEKREEESSKEENRIVETSLMNASTLAEPPRQVIEEQRETTLATSLATLKIGLENSIDSENTVSKVTTDMSIPVPLVEPNVTEASVEEAVTRKNEVTVGNVVSLEKTENKLEESTLRTGVPTNPFNQESRTTSRPFIKNSTIEDSKEEKTNEEGTKPTMESITVLDISIASNATKDHATLMVPPSVQKIPQETVPLAPLYKKENDSLVVSEEPQDERIKSSTNIPNSTTISTYAFNSTKIPSYSTETFSKSSIETTTATPSSKPNNEAPTTIATAVPTTTDSSKLDPSLLTKIATNVSSSTIVDSSKTSVNASIVKEEFSRIANESQIEEQGGYDLSTTSAPRIENSTKASATSATQIQKLNSSSSQSPEDGNLEDKWQLIHQTAPSWSTKFGQTALNKKPESWTTLADKTKVESTTRTNNEGESSEIGPTVSSFAEATITLDASKSIGGLDTSTRNTSTDIVNFSRLCNELAFKFWISANKGLSTARSLALSPFGMISLLSMIFLGARGPTSEQMNEVLGLDNVATFNPHLIFQNVTDAVSLARQQGIANAAFVRELFADKGKVRKLMPFYKEQAQQFYEGLVAEVNFATISDLARRRTNLLVRKQTGGRIKDFVKSNAVPLRSPLAAISANVFQTDCNSSLASANGRDGELYFAVSPHAGSSAALRMSMRKLIPVPAIVWRSNVLAGYEPSLDATAIALGGVGKLVSTIFLFPGQQGHAAPGDTLDRLEQRLVKGAFRDGFWDKLLKVLIPRSSLELQLPKFSHRSVVNATAALKRMGLDQLFSGRADFKGINGIGNHLFLSDVLQMNLFSTCGDENIANGRHHVETYPASPSSRNSEGQDDRDNSEEESLDSNVRSYIRGYRSILNRGTSRISEKSGERPRLKLDQPFLYFVRHNPTGLVLHMGRFNPKLLS